MSDWPDKPATDDRVRVDDPWGPSGLATVVEVQTTPHHAVLVRIDGISRDQWVLGPHVKPITKEDTND